MATDPYKDWGGGPPFRLSHGWPPNSDNWETPMLFLAANGSRVIATIDAGTAGRGKPGPATTWTASPTTWRPS